MQCNQFLGGKPAFLYLGNLCKRKAVDILIRAYAKVYCEHKNMDWLLIIVGHDSTKGKYVKLADRLGIKDRLLFRGSVAVEKLSSIMRAAKVLVLPSRFDGWGVVLNEAASVELALIASDKVGSSYHLIKPGVNGFRVKAGDVNSLVYSLNAYVKNHNLAAMHGKRSKTIYKDFTPKENASHFINTVNAWNSKFLRKKYYANDIMLIQ